MLIDVVENYWYCRELDNAGVVCPPGGINFFTGYDINSTPAPLDPDEVTGNPIGTCHCEGEFWMAEGCKYGFICDPAAENGGEYISCPVDGEILLVDFQTREWTCSSEYSCIGGPIEGSGCVKPDCTSGNNPFGTCECDGQFYINEDCTEGFLCTTNIPDPYLYDGCYQKCFEGQVLRPDFATKSWSCVNPDTYTCTGSFHLECPANAISSDLDGTYCDCENDQLIISDDCTGGFYCS